MAEKAPQVIEGAEGFRVFVNLGSYACSSGCSYCYVQLGRSIPIDWQEIKSALNGFLESKLFIPGRNGTIVTFGGHTEIFRNRALIDLLIRALPLVCRFGNPVQISTKQLISKQILKAIEACTEYSGQITLFVSCASLSNVASVERAADPPIKRWGTFSNLQGVGLPCALLIKPWLGSITQRDLTDFAELAVEHRLDGVCLGALYVIHNISKRLNSLDFRRQSEMLAATHPLISEPQLAFSPPVSVFTGFRAQLHPIRLFPSSICMTAAFADVCCPLHNPRPCFVP